ncbi:hypothetical protein [Bradyrhizobium forestalis]|uniref:hypothetical protein n=1 Tax=Bradyrhizobium forestalis TaxID=1419263 RepID=UPI0013040DDC|nr:hypothetical protein [Bradyrhizobium forestalis]
MAKIDWTFPGWPCAYDWRWAMQRPGWPGFVHSTGVRVMDQANIPATARSKCRRIALPIDRELTWPELVWQQIDVAQYIDQHV